MKSPPRGEVWLVDLGLAAKVRPCLVFSVPILGTDRSVIALVPHTTSVRGTRFETPTTVRYLKLGAFDAQGIVTVPLARLVRRLGTLTPIELGEVERAVLTWLGMKGGAS